MFKKFFYHSFSEDEKTKICSRKAISYLSKSVIKKRKSSSATAAIPLTSKHSTKNKYIYLSQSDIEISFPSKRVNTSCFLDTNNRPQSAKEQSNSTQFANNNPLRVSNKRKLYLKQNLNLRFGENRKKERFIYL